MAQKNEVTLLPEPAQELLEDIKQLRNETADQRVANQQYIMEDMQPRQVFLEAKLTRYKAEVQVMKATDQTFDTLELETVQNGLLQEIARDIQEVQDATTTLRSKKIQLTQEIESERALAAELNQVQTALSRRLASSQQRMQSTDGRSVEADDTRRKIKVVSEDNRKLLTLMTTFLDDYFPAPDEAQEASAKRMRDADNNPLSRQNVTTLHELLEDLMNACISRPHDPYIVISDKYWGPYVELVVRAGIALYHPQNKDKIKLVEFHL